MNLCIISGSTRKESGSKRVATYLANQLAEIAPTEKVDVLDLQQCAFPMWDEDVNVADFADSKSLLEQADGFIFVVPEWHGMVPPAVKNLFFLFAGVFRHKPAYIVTVSTGSGGRYPIAELRTSSYKNSVINYIPVNTIIDKLNTVIDEHGNYIAESEFIKRRLDEGVRILLEYSNAFIAIRESDIVKEKRFPNGV